MSLTPEQLHDLCVFAAGVSTPLVLTGVASWFVLWRNEWKQGTQLSGEAMERAKRRGDQS